MTVDNDGSNRDHLLRALSVHHTTLGAYVYAIVRDVTMTEDILGDLAVLVAKKSREFDIARPLGPLFRRIAKNLCMRALKESARKPAAVDFQVLNVVSAEIDTFQNGEGLSARLAALQKCKSRLSRQGRRMIELRYFENLSYEEIGSRLNRSIKSLYVSMCRIHRELEKCIRRRLGMGNSI